jgi:hypothetical protein
MENVVTKRTRKKSVQSMKPISSEKVVTEEDIRRRAFEIYLQDGNSSSQLDNWLQAERELKKSSQS